MRVTEEYLDAILDREHIHLDAYDFDRLTALGFGPRQVSEGGQIVTDLMIRCPCDGAYRWRFYIAIADNPEGGAELYGFRDGMITAPGHEYREFNGLRQMSRFNAGQDIDGWMVETLRTMMETDAVTVQEADE